MGCSTSRDIGAPELSSRTIWRIKSSGGLIAQDRHKLPVWRNDRALGQVGDFSDTREVKAYRVPRKRVCERYAVDLLNDPVDGVDQTIQDSYNCIDGCERDGL